MTLSASERSSLAHELILSLDDLSDYDLSQTQETEVRRRLRMVQGELPQVARRLVFADIKARYS